MKPLEQIPFTTPKPSRTPVMLSALCMPGLGQFVQRRWISGVLFSLLFLLFFGVICYRAWLFFSAQWQLAVAFIDNRPAPAVPAVSIADIVIPFGCAVVVYLINLADVSYAHISSCRKWAETQLHSQIRSSLVVATALCLMWTCRMKADPIHDAVSMRDVGRTASILEQSPSSVANAADEGGVTPMHIAAALNQTSIIGMLSARSARVDACTTGGFTPLHWAAGRDAFAAARLLLQLGADVNATNSAGVTPLHWAAGKNATNTLVLLLRCGANWDISTDTGQLPLHWAIEKNAADSALLLAYKQAVDTQLSAGREPSVTPPQEAPPPGIVSGLVMPSPPDDDTTPRRKVEPGASLVVPIGRGESLRFVWIPEMKLWVGKYEITNGQFRRFRSKHNSLFRDQFSLNGNDQPVVYVSWNDAVEFCEWMNLRNSDVIPAGFAFRLPTSDEWTAFASCGTKRRYPWGDQWPPKYGNFSDLTARMHFPEWRGISGYEDGQPVTCSVYNSGANEWDLYGVAGNVWEWCSDWHDDQKMFKVRRGGSWDFDEQFNLAIAHRGFDRPETRDDTIGFRIVAAPK